MWSVRRTAGNEAHGSRSDEPRSDLRSRKMIHARYFQAMTEALSTVTPCRTNPQVIRGTQASVDRSVFGGTLSRRVVSPHSGWSAEVTPARGDNEK
jgi:hypothetical protein